jgi:hypothetical protein
MGGLPQTDDSTLEETIPYLYSRLTKKPAL